MPLLEVGDDFTLAESMVILEYLEDEWPREAVDARRRALERLLASTFSSSVPYFPLLKAAEGSAEEAEALGALTDGLRAVDAFLRAHGSTTSPFFTDGFGMADAACAPFLMRLRLVLPLLTRHDPAAMCEAAGCDRMLRWMDAVCDRPSCEDSLPPPETLAGNFKAMLARMSGGAPSSK